MKDWLKYLGLATGWISLNLISYRNQTIKGYSGTVEKPPSKVSIVLPALYEDHDTLRNCIESLKNQTVVKAYPQYFEFIAVGDPQGDGCFAPFASQFDKILPAPYGKLKARHVGITNSSGDIIVAVDADCWYPPMWLNNILKPFKDPSVVGATTPTVYVPDVYEPVANILKNLVYMGKMSGRGSAFRKDAYFRVGGFDLTIDEFNDWDAVVQEEEYKFLEKLLTVGNVVFVNTPVYTKFREPTPKRVRPYLARMGVRI